MRGSEGRGAAPSPGSDREFPSLYHYSCHLFFLSVAPASQLAVSWCCGRVRELRGKEKRGECAFKKAFAINGIFSLSQVIFFIIPEKREQEKEIYSYTYTIRWLLLLPSC